MSDKLVSPGGLYETNIQDDGNLVTYRRADGVPVWASGGDPHPLPPPQPLPPPVGRSGIVRVMGRSLSDDLGAWLALGTTYFPMLWLVKWDPTRLLENLAWLQQRGVDFVRVFADVHGPTWDDRAVHASNPQWPDQVTRAIEIASDFQMRLAWTLFGGPYLAQPSTWYKQKTREFAALIAPRRDRVQYVEIRNEVEGPDATTARECAALLRAAFPDLPVALCGTPEKELPNIYDGSQANLATVHWDRTKTERGWRPVRQPWGYYDLQRMPVCHVDGEPIGINSSVASQDDPLLLASAAITGWVTGEASYCLHTGAGIRAGGAADLARTPPRKANVWEQPTFDEALAYIGSARTLLPTDLPGWNRSRHDKPEHPLELHTETGDTVEAPGGVPGCNRCYAMSYGDRAVVFVAGISQYFSASSRAGAFDVYRPDAGAWKRTERGTEFNLQEREGRAALLIR